MSAGFFRVVPTLLTRVRYLRIVSFPLIIHCEIVDCYLKLHTHAVTLVTHTTRRCFFQPPCLSQARQTRTHLNRDASGFRILLVCSRCCTVSLEGTFKGLARSCSPQRRSILGTLCKHLSTRTVHSAPQNRAVATDIRVLHATGMYICEVLLGCGASVGVPPSRCCWKIHWLDEVVFSKLSRNLLLLSTLCALLSLCELCLSRNRLLAEGALLLTQHFSKLTSLKRLYLSNTSLNRPEGSGIQLLDRHECCTYLFCQAWGAAR